jgi:hypothetical protein
MAETSPSLIEQVEARVRRTSHFQIRELAVEQARGKFIIRGRVPTYHAKQLALHGALELLPAGSIDAEITVG